MRYVITRGRKRFSFGKPGFSQEKPGFSKKKPCQGRGFASVITLDRNVLMRS
jgi:hypothetical protein